MLKPLRVTRQTTVHASFLMMAETRTVVFWVDTM